MKPILNIAKAELQKLFYSPVAWIILIAFTVQYSFLFTVALGGQFQFKYLKIPLENLTFNLFLHPLFGTFGSILGYLYLYIPLLTMNMMSKELSTGSIKLLYSSPVTNLQIIVGKFLSLVGVGAIFTAIAGVFCLYAGLVIDNFDTAPVLCGLLGIFLVFCSFSAIGLYLSSVTSYPIVAVIGTFAVLGALSLVSQFGQDYKFVRDVTYWLSINKRGGTFTIGMITSEDLLYFLLIIIFFLALTIVRLQNVRQKNPSFITIRSYAVVITLFIFMGYLTTVPRLKWYKDFTYSQVSTLSLNSQSVVKNLPYGLTVHSYVNLLDRYASWGLPRGYKYDQSRYEPYYRFKPEIKFVTTYYYKKSKYQNESLDRMYPGRSDQQKVDSLMERWGVKVDAVPYKKGLAGEVDLESEDFKLLKVLESSNGKKTILRTFDDGRIFPEEDQISASMIRLTHETPMIGFLGGHGERSIFNAKESGYKFATQEKGFRYSLLNSGLDFREVLLQTPIPSNIDVLVIADMKTALTKQEKENFDKYLARGGNLIIAGEPTRQTFMNEVVNPLGVQFLPGELAMDSEQLDPDIVTAPLNESAQNFSPMFKEIIKQKLMLGLRSAVGLKIFANRGFKVQNLFSTDSAAWNNPVAIDMKNDSVTFNAADGEKKASYTVAMALSRIINKKDQRILVVGDADMWSSGTDGITSIYPGVAQGAKYFLLQAAIHWMTYDKVPIDTSHPKPLDNKLKVSKQYWMISTIFLNWVFSGLMLLTGVVIWIRRRSK